MSLEIREERGSDIAAIRAVNIDAFRGEAEARLVECLRDDGAVLASLVAVDRDRVVGHVMFSRVHVAGSAARLAALAPIAVDPSYQRKGAGTALIRRGLERCRELGCQAVVVVGDPNFYPRFGFANSAAGRLLSDWSNTKAWMALELEPGALARIEGRVVYPRAFDVVSAAGEAAATEPPEEE